MLLIDEYSTGIDAATKRHMWATLKRVARGKAVVITTRTQFHSSRFGKAIFADADAFTDSMEEASALSNRVGILARKMLGKFHQCLLAPMCIAAETSFLYPAVGTISSLAARYPAYELHFACRTPADVLRIRALMARHFPGSRQAEDVATRWEIPIDQQSLADLFRVLSKQEGLPDFAVERLGLEVVFLKVIKEHNIQEEGATA